MKNVRFFLVTLALIGLSMSAWSQDTYSIIRKGNIGSSYFVYLNGTNLFGGSTAAALQRCIDTIKVEAAGEDCIIEFGGNNALNIGGGSTTLITFDGGTNGTDWGTVTLTGKATTSNFTSSNGIICLENGVSMECKAELTGVVTSGYSGAMLRNNSTGTLTISEGADISMTDRGMAVRNQSTGTLTINGGSLSTTNGNAVFNYAGGTVNISGGTVSTTSSDYFTVYNGSGTVNINGGSVSATSDAAVGNDVGTVNISGGTVSATTGYAVYLNSAGKVTISGTAVLTSARTDASSGTIYLSDNGSLTDWRLRISGGTVENTATGNAIYQNSAGEIQIRGGMILAKEGYAIRKGAEGTGTISLSNNGIVFAYGEDEEAVISGSYAQTGDAVLAAWDKDAGTTTYQAGTSEDIFKLPATATAVWAVEGSGSGISVVNGTTTGFIPIAEVTVEGVGISNYGLGMMDYVIYPNPTNGKLTIRYEESEMSSEIEVFDVVGRK
ncbi:MAG: hypothetical protein FWH36_08570, partial [Lentimicrobiaceae bacterium]|nr:hypothetical protein [Lentimicrobiaceae bacterium]